MKFTIKKQPLLTAILQVQKVASSKTTMPILAGIRIIADEQGIKLTATDLEISIETIVPLEIDGEEILKVSAPGGIVLSARYLTDIIRKLPTSTVDFEVQQGFLAIIRSGTSEINLHGQDVEEFPRLPAVQSNQIFSLPSDLFKDLIRQTVFAVSTEEIRPIFTGVRFSLENGILKLLATDSHRLASREAQVEAAADLQFSGVVVPGKSLVELSRLLEEDDSLVDVLVAENQILIQMKQTQFYSRLIDGQYPDTSRIIPTVFKTTVQLNTKDLLNAAERAALIAKDNDNHVIRFNLKQESIEITSNSPDVGKISETLFATSKDGEDLLIAFNASFLLQALRVMDSNEITLEFNGSMTAFLIKMVDNRNYLHLLLPVRIY
ncbi:MAG: polymerase subunit beta [Bacilli bacterium]|nr:polymerase subunit beta [Bacilli bacterium]